MFTIDDRSTRLCDGINRREWLRLGGLSAAGLSLPSLLRAAERPPAGIIKDPTFGTAKSVIYVWLQGGPPQHETFDPKPDAPSGVRGPFQPIQTNVAGIHFGELLPRISRIADKLAVVRSLHTDSNIHSASGYHVVTGYKYRGPNARTISSTDWPYFGSIVKKLKPSEKLPPLSTVWIPVRMRLNENVMPAGQTAGFLGRQWDPDRFEGDPSDPHYKIDGFQQHDVPPLRLRRRMSLLHQVEQHFGHLQHGKPAGIYDKFQEQAFDILVNGRVKQAFDLSRESQKTRDEFGRTKWGQSLLLARRLVEVGVRLVHVNWTREPGDSAVDNPMWDTHAMNADRCEDVLCPMFDVGFSALIRDLDRRGLLKETLVVAVGEFGRTPKINAKAGRDHWGSVFSFAMAGGGIAAGQVYGSSDNIGGHPAKNPVTPGDLTATIFHLLGIRHDSTFHDAERREHRLTEGEPLRALLGDERSVSTLVTPGGNIARVPAYDDSLLRNTGFEADLPLRSADFGSRPKGWRADPLARNSDVDALAVKLITADALHSRSGVRHAAIGFGIDGGLSAVKIKQGQKAILAQEIRNPRLGRFTFSVNVRTEATSKTFFEKVFLKHFTCKLLIYRYSELTKDPRQRQDFIAETFAPKFAAAGKIGYQSFSLTKVLDSAKPGQNFPIGKGYGVAILLEKTSPGELNLPPGSFAFLRIDDVVLDFNSRTINEKVKA